MMNTIRGPSSKESLTWREIEILHLIQEGCSNKEIAQKLSLTVETVKWYNQQIYGKLGVTSRTQAIEKGFDAGILNSHRLFPPPISAFSDRHVKHNLPAPLSTFIGRKKELADLRAVLNGSTARLITILGPGGIGKTRLALLAAQEALAYFEHGVWLVDLAALTDPGLLAQTVLHTLDIENHEQLSDEEALVRALREQALLLVMDNCEHLVETCARLVRLLLAGCPNLRILVTSREVLGVEGEQHYPLHALAFPDPQRLPPNIKEFRNYEAVQLFIERVVQACPGYAITQHNISTIAQVCQRLEGIPLALELAAARTSLLSVEEIDAHLADCFSVLAQTGLAVDPRHHTMQAALDWSYNLLREPEQILLRRLAVFSGGWTLAAAEAVCTEPGILPSGQILDMLNSLVNKSMVVAEHLPGQETRCRLLEPIRQYLVEKQAQAGETESIKVRHLDYYLMLAKQAEPHLRTHLAVEWLNRLEFDLDNFRSSLCWSQLNVAHRTSSLTSDSERPIEKGLQLASSLVWFWGLRNHCIEGAEWLDRLIHEQQDQGWQQLLDSPARVTRARALYSLGIIIAYSRGAIHSFPPMLIAQMQAFLQESQTIFHELGEAAYLRDWAILRYLMAETEQELLECRELFQILKEPFWMAECDKELVFPVKQDQELANFYLDENLTLRKEIGDLEGLAWALKVAAVLQFGNHEQYCDLMQRCLDCYEKLGNRWMAARNRSLLVRYLIDLGDYSKAARQIGLMQVSLSEFHDQTLLLHYLRYRGYLAWAKGEYQEAVDCGFKGLALAQQMIITNEAPFFFPLYILVRAALSQRDVCQARNHLKSLFTKEMLFLEERSWKEFFIFASIHALCLLAAIEGKLEQAARLIGAQDALLEQDGHLMHRLTPRGRADFEQAYEAIQAGLDDDTFTLAFQAGRVVTTEQLIQLAQVLCGTDPPNHSRCEA